MQADGLSIINSTYKANELEVYLTRRGVSMRDESNVFTYYYIF